MPSVGFSQALVTQDFAAKPTLLATEGAFHHKPHFVDGRVAGQLAGTKRLVLDSLVLDAVFDVPFFQPKKSVWENYPVAGTGRQSGGCN